MLQNIKYVNKIINLFVLWKFFHNFANEFRTISFTLKKKGKEMKKDYESKMSEFADEEYPSHKGSANKLAISRRQKIAKNIKMMSKVVADCGCVVGVDKHIETLYVEGSSAKEVDACLGVIEVYFHFVPLESITFVDDSKIVWIRKRSGREEIIEK